MNQRKIPLGFYLITGNHLEELAARLAELLKSPTVDESADLLRPDWIMVQSKGMQRWLSMSLARHNGICSNLAFPFPNTFLEYLYRQVAGALPDSNPFGPSSLTFRIMQFLPELIREHEFKPLQRYLANNPHPLKQYQLAAKIAEVFDQYLVFRPEMISQWESGKDRSERKMPIWQALLWRRITADIATPHPARMQQELVAHLLNPDKVVRGLPPRMFMFGISHLPLFHLRVLQALAERLPVFLFLLNPCRQYWQDIFSDRQMVRLRSTKQDTILTKEALHLERGNRLLASWGQLGKQFFDIIQSFETQSLECFRNNSTTTLLGRIQQDILDLVDPSPNSDRQPPKADRTVRVHASHSPMREVEVLYDQLLDILDHAPDIEPRDIMVMAPDIIEYKPYVHAVFGACQEGEEVQIPYSVADQHVSSESPVVSGFLQLLDLHGRRFEASHVLALLENSNIHRRFELLANDLPLVENWIRKSNIRWGWDAQERKRLGLPAFAENTWRAGLDRLLLGYALIGNQNDLFAGILPYEGIEGSDARILGCLVAFAEALHQSLDQLSQQAPPSKWREVLGALLDRFFLSDEAAAQDFQILRSVLDQLDQAAQSANCDLELPFEVIRQYLVDTLHHKPSGAGFLAGGITFCSMLPMRSIPAKVICILGLQHDAFPRETREPEFNLIAAYPQPMDRSKRDDDKYLFLEALLSARRVLYLSFVGRNIQDNSPIPPSAMVSELLEYLEDSYGICADHLIVDHPLQAFSQSYFNGSQARLFSYSKENKEASLLLSLPGRIDAFFPEPLDIPSDSWRQCELKQLVSFYSHPTRFLLEERLGIHFQETIEPVLDREKFNLNALDRYQIEQRLLASWQNEQTNQQTYNALHLSGDLPHGTAGKVLHDQLATGVRQFGQLLSPYLTADPVRSELIDLILSPFRLHGKVDGLLPNLHISYRMAKLRPNDLLSLFIQHLALCASADIEQPMTSLFICKDAIWRFEPEQMPAEILKRYLELYWEGLRRPIHFFARTSFAYAYQIVVDGKSKEAAKSQAWKKWKGSDFAPGESQDAYLARCFKHQEPLDEEFEKLAMTVFQPLLIAGRQASPPA